MPLRVRRESASKISRAFEFFPEFVKTLGWPLHRNSHRKQITKITRSNGFTNGGKEGVRFKKIILNVRIALILLHPCVVSIEIEKQINTVKLNHYCYQK